MFLAVGLSLSRAATAIALILMMTFAVRGRRGYALVKSLLLGGSILTGVMLAYTYWQPFRDRFEKSDGFEIGGVTLGSSGRSNLWAAVFAHWQQSPWFGFGAGSSETYVLQRFVTIAHPHNDYLRLLHDFGIIGLTLWVLAIVGLLTGAHQRYKASTGADQAIHLAAILGLVQLLLFMIANNPIVSGFQMLGLAAIIGVSIARNSTGPAPTEASVTGDDEVLNAPPPRANPFWVVHNQPPAGRQGRS
jgi:O-antigen ligase